LCSNKEGNILISSQTACRVLVHIMIYDLFIITSSVFLLLPKALPQPSDCELFLTPAVKCDYRVSQSRVSNSNTFKIFATNCKFFRPQASFSPPPILRVWGQRVSKGGGGGGGGERERESRPTPNVTVAFPLDWKDIMRPSSATWRPQRSPGCRMLCNQRGWRPTK